MKPHIYKIKDTEIYLDAERSCCGDTRTFTLDKGNATIFRTRNDMVMATLTDRYYNGNYVGWVDPDNYDVIIALEKAGYRGEKRNHIRYSIPANDIETVYVEDKEVTPVDFDGEYVIKIKGTGVYLRPSTDRLDGLTVIKSEAKVYSNPKTDVIGKLEKGLRSSGTAKANETPVKTVWICKGSTRGKRVIERFISDDEAKEVAKSLRVTYCEITLWDDITKDRGTCSCSVDIPLEYLEREKL